MRFPLIGIERHRIGTDGIGVTTLVAFHGCPLRCRYCLNYQCLKPEGVRWQKTPQEVLDEVMIDNLYFLATDGGITFGGGEPAQRSTFIEEFCRIAPQEWHITMETSLNVDHEHLKRLLPYIHHYLVDIKDMNPDIYRAYTGRDNQRVIDNLQWLAEQGKCDNVTIRLPHIPEFNTPDDITHSRKQLEAMGYHGFDEFDYITDVREYKESTHTEK